MSVACLPFVLALATKENPISVLTRVAYEKLNVFHRWLSWAMYALALVHTFPYIVYHRQQGDMGMQWGMSAYYWTGVIAILAQSWLQFMSFGAIRNRYYELFKATHLLFAAMFFAFLFIHVGFTLTSVDYLIAAGVLYLLCWGSAMLRTVCEYGPKSIPARLELLPHNVMKISVPTTSPWKPGQHIFVRFLNWNVHSLTAHPFTIASLPNREGLVSEQDAHEMTFYVHPRGGYTGRLAALAKQEPNRKVRVALDGPYGGMKDHSLGKFDRAVIISGGAGASFVLPVLEDLLRRRARRGPMDVRVVFGTKTDEHAEWFQEQVAALIAQYRAKGVMIEVYVSRCECTKCGCAKVGNCCDTDVRSSEEADIGKDVIEEEKRVGSDSESEELNMTRTKGRPDTIAVVARSVESFRGRVGIAVCGPENMVFDVRNAVAAAQTRVGPGGPAEVYLYSELFGW